LAHPTSSSYNCFCFAAIERRDLEIINGIFQKYIYIERERKRERERENEEKKKEDEIEKSSNPESSLDTRK
jgi:hypothetical protein